MQILKLGRDPLTHLLAFPSDGGEGIDHTLDVVELAQQIRGFFCRRRRRVHFPLNFPPHKRSLLLALTSIEIWVMAWRSFWNYLLIISSVFVPVRWAGTFPSLHHYDLSFVRNFLHYLGPVWDYCHFLKKVASTMIRVIIWPTSPWAYGGLPSPKKKSLA